MAADAAIEDHGEDSFCASIFDNSAIVGVFDGCGGLGSRLLPKLDNHTSAYIASRIVSGAVYDWAKENDSVSWTSGSAMTKSIDAKIKEAFSVAAPAVAGGLKMRGTMVRELPTTCAFAVVRDAESGVDIHSVWAGDSRVYFLSEDGLYQVTNDDVDDEDALSNLTNDGSLNNVISSDGNYVLHSCVHNITAPVVVIAATDGCFGYLNTPMEFEHAILKAILEAGSMSEIQQNLKTFFASVAGDDYSFGMASFFCEDFSAMQNLFRKRYDELVEKYINPLSDRSPENVQKLWAAYKPEYETFLAGKE